MLNLRLLRFIKNYFPSLNYRSKKHSFLQIQGYWIRNNWELFQLTGEVKYRDLALKCSNYVLRAQRVDGSWEYPLNEWKSRVSTVEGIWASLGLLLTYKCTGNRDFLAGALKWYNFLINKTGFQRYGNSLAINYFNVPTARKVPNNATLAIRFFAELYSLTNDKCFLKYTDSLIAFLELCQNPNGELSYEVGKQHYLCYHYNSFEFMDLFFANEILNSKKLFDIMRRLSKFVASGVMVDGSVKYDCEQTYPEEIMFSSIAGAALIGASVHNFGDFSGHIAAIYRYVETNQRSDGSFILTKHDMPYVIKPIKYGILSDSIPYPGPMSFILHSLLFKAQHLKNSFDVEYSLKIRSGYFFTLYMLSIVVYVISCLLSQTATERWILDGIVFQTIVFVIFSITLAHCITNNAILAAIVSFFIIVLNIVPGLKYPIFYGVFDSPGHYRFASEIAVLGHVPTNEFYSTTYGGNAGMHLTLASMSLVSDISMNTLFAFVAPALFGLVPLIIYFIGNRVLDSTTMKFTIIAAALPTLSAYEVWGTSLSFILYFLLGAIFLRIVLFKIEAKSLLIFIIISFTLIASHAITSLFFAILLFGITIFLILLARLKGAVTELFSFVTFGVVSFLYTFLLVIWWTTVDTVNIRFFSDVVSQIFQQEMSVISPTFFELPIVSRLQSFIVLNASNVVLIFLTVIGFVVFLKSVEKNQKCFVMRPFYWFVVGWICIVGSFLIVQVATNFGLFSYQRLLIYATPWCVFLCGLALMRLNISLSFFNPKLKRLFLTALTIFLVFVCLIQFYPYQPLIPKAADLSADLASNSYVVDLTLVNSLNQIAMIDFAENHSKEGLIIADLVTRSQTYGFSNISFFSRIDYSSPLTMPELLNRNWSLFMLHYGLNGPFREGAVYRTDEVIQNISTHNSVIYDNGGSFLMIPQK
jgi:hypothetical protein